MSNQTIRHVRLDNPPVNALSQSLRASVVDQIRSANGDEAVTAIVLHGSDKAFSAGADITEFGTPKVSAAPGFPDMLAVVEGSAKPVVAAISGVCMGGGLELALAAHARVARPDARLALPEVNIGIIPGAGGTQTLARAIGERRAKELILSGKSFTAQEALDWGMANAVVEARELADRAVEIAATIARNAPLATRQAKQSIHRGLQMSLRDGLTFEIEAYNRLVPTRDRQEGINAANEKRPPRFTGA